MQLLFSVWEVKKKRPQDMLILSWKLMPCSTGAGKAGQAGARWDSVFWACVTQGTRLKPGGRASERTVGEVEPVPRNEVKARKRLGKIHAYTIDKTIDLTR